MILFTPEHKRSSKVNFSPQTQLSSSHVEHKCVKSRGRLRITGGGGIPQPPQNLRIVPLVCDTRSLVRRARSIVPVAQERTELGTDSVSHLSPACVPEADLREERRGFGVAPAVPVAAAMGEAPGRAPPRGRWDLGPEVSSTHSGLTRLPLGQWIHAGTGHVCGVRWLTYTFCD